MTGLEQRLADFFRAHPHRVVAVHAFGSTARGTVRFDCDVHQPHMTISAPAALPADDASRIESIDVLRGLALLGMLVVHFHMRSSDPGGFGEIVRTFVWRMVESKSHGTFALLFGAGFAIQLRNAEARGRALAPAYVRRLIVLAVFGFIAHAGFGYNVLLGYATWGVALLLVRSWSTRALLAAAILSAASVSLYELGTTAYIRRSAGPAAVTAAREEQRTVAAAVNGALTSAEAQGRYAELVVARLRHMAWFYTQPFFFMPGATMSLFLAGLLLVRHRVFERVVAYRRPLAIIAAIGLVAWLADNWLLPAWGVSTTFGILRDQWLTFTYVGGALLLFSDRPRLLFRLRAVASAGRMALTNYLMQIAALDMLFSGYAIGLREVHPATGLSAALACFTAQAAFSSLWLRHFRFGPAEWVWRTLTHGTVQPMRDRDAARGAAQSVGARSLHG